MRAISWTFGAALLVSAGITGSVGCQFVTAVDRDLVPGGEGGSGGGAGGGGQGGQAQGGGGQGGGAPDPCTDGTQNGAETDVDCGGGTCAGCASGMSCGGAGDCASGTCTGGTCVDVVLISEVRTRGLGGSTDEFVELYNAGNADVTTDASWVLEVRAAPQNINQCGSSAYIARWAGNGATIPSHGHLLIAAEGYTQMPAADVVIMGTGFLPDAASVRLMHGADVADAVCFYFNQQTQGSLTCPAAPFTCEGTPIENPHDGSAATDTDESLERLPGGTQGNAADTNDNSADFAAITPATPESTTSPATP